MQPYSGDRSVVCKLAAGSRRTGVLDIRLRPLNRESLANTMAAASILVGDRLSSAIDNVSTFHNQTQPDPLDGRTFQYGLCVDCRPKSLGKSLLHQRRCVLNFHVFIVLNVFNFISGIFILF